ncbi:MAG TPA: choline/ethanolamine kinase family protein [Alphaproteobacteria bacterium]|nr:choline/ethanolamine kinase family protein [Alphaproteobacteria bacterium]
MSSSGPPGDARERALNLGFWSGPLEIEPLKGGITNRNFLVRQRGERYVVRIGGDIPIHGVMRFNELAAAEAAFQAGISPEILHHEPGAIVMRFVEGRTLTAAELRAPAMLARIVPLLQRVHTEMPKYLRGPVLAFWVFHVLRDYAHTLSAAGSAHAARLPRLMEIAARLEQAVGAIELVFAHNDLLAANFIDAGKRLWLVDWDYAGFNSALFDLANLASNADLAPADELRMLEAYYGRPADATRRRRFQAMKCASLLREAMWSMVSEICSAIDFDYAAYTAENLARFERIYAAFERPSVRP